MTESPRRTPRRLELATWAFAVVAALGLGVYLAKARPAETLWGDEPTYLAMATSLARDGDLKYTESDRAWVLERQPGALILQRPNGAAAATEGAELAYSKPIVFPVLVAPFVRLFGERGVLWANLLLLAGALALAWDYLYRFGDRPGARAAWLTFLVASPVLPYTLWRMSETAQLSFALGGLALACRDLRFPPGGDRRATVDWRRLAAAGVLLGLLVALRLPNLVVAFAPVAAWLLARRVRPALILAGSITLTLAVGTGLTELATGSPNPYRAVRTSFDERTGYPTTPTAAPETAEQTGETPGETIADAAHEAGGAPEGSPGPQASARFETAPAKHRAYWTLAPEWSRTLYATLFSLVGRHTGLLIYFPALFVLLPTLVRGDRLTLCLATAAVGLHAFYLLWLPGNYFGGSTFLGNRYWLAAFPLLLVALPRLPSNRVFAVGWTVATALGLSAVLGVLETDRAGRVDSQGHVRGPIHRRLPIDSSAAAVDGWRNRKWNGQVVRFLDPHAVVEEQGFRLLSGDPEAELLFSLPETAPPLFAARAETGGELRVESGRTDETFALEPGQTTFVRVPLERPWRRHPQLPGPSLDIHPLAFRFEGAGGSVELRYLGAGTELETAYRVRRATLPTSGFAGSTADAWIGMRNHSNWPWLTGGVTPVTLRYRFEPEGGGAPIAGPSLPLPANIPPQGTLRIPFAIRLPETPGRYELVVDLEQEFVGPFAERVGEPVARLPIAIGESLSPPRTP